MRNIRILLAFALFSYVTQAISFGGYPNITIKGNQDPGSCSLTLTAQLQADQITFTEKVDNPNSNCNYPNLQFAAVFRGEPPLTGNNITLKQSVDDATIYTGWMTVADVEKNNGTACGHVGENADSGEDLWICKFKYGDIFFEFALWVDQCNDDINTTWTDLFGPHYGRGTLVSENGVNLLTLNNSWREVDATLPNSLTGEDTTVSDLSQPIYVRGHIQGSNPVNLSSYFADFHLNVIGVKKADGSYLIYRPDKELFPFSADNQGPNNTTNTGLTWDQPLESLNDCIERCQVSIVLQKGGQVYLLQTTGITTKSARRMRL